MLLPPPRGSLSDALVRTLSGPPEGRVELPPAQDGPDDESLALWVLHELHYRGFDDADDRWEWHPALAPVRHSLETRLEQRLRARYRDADPGGEFAAAFFAFVAGHEGPSVAAFVQTDADQEQVLDLLRWRSLYHLKEADPTAWVVPRLSTVPQAGLVELQYDEYGAGDPRRLHAHLFREAMEACGLSSTYGDYVDETPCAVLEQNNAMTLFGLHRRLRGAALGHFAAFEATSSFPSRRMVLGVERLGLPAALVDYYSEHVEADAVHEQLAVRTVCAGLLADEPELRAEVFFGAFTCLDLEARVGAWALRQWAAAA